MVVAAARALVERGAKIAIVTAGSAGAAIAEARERTIHWIIAPSVPVANPMGAGDAFAAGLAVAIVRKLGAVDATRFAVAVGSASVQHPRAGCLDADRVDALAGSVCAVTAG